MDEKEKVIKIKLTRNIFHGGKPYAVGDVMKLGEAAGTNIVNMGKAKLLEDKKEK